MKLYITDLDGTLLSSNGQLSEYTIKTIQELIDKDVYVTFATARSLFTANVVLNYIDFKIPALVYNGGAIIDPEKKEFIQINTIDKDICTKIFEFLTPDKTQPFVLGIKDGKEILQHKEVKTNEHKKFINSRLKFNDKRHRLVDDYYLLDEMVNFVFIDKAERISIVEEEIRKYSDVLNINRYTNTRYGEGIDYLGVNSKKANKGHMIKELAKILDVDIKNVTAFGDEINDIDMIKTAGTGIAMGNAVDKLKSIADKVIGSNDDNSVVNYIKEEN